MLHLLSLTEHQSPLCAFPPVFHFPQLPHKSEYPQTSLYTLPLPPSLAQHPISSLGEVAAGDGWPAQWQVAPGEATAEYGWKRQGFRQSIAPGAPNTRVLLL